MPPPSLPAPDEVLSLLRGVIDPELGSDIVDLGMARAATVASDGAVVVTIALTTAGCPLRAQIQQDVRARVGSLPGVTSVKLDWTEMTDEQRIHEVARLFATAVLRLQARPVAASSSSEIAPESSAHPLELSRPTRLSVTTG